MIFFTLNGKTCFRGNRTLKGTQRCWRTLPHSIPKLPLEVLKLGIWAGPSTSVWPNHLRKFFSYFCVTVGLRVSILHPICIVVQLWRVIWFREVLHRESDVLWKVLSVVSVPFCVCPALNPEEKTKWTYRQNAQQIELGSGRHLSTLCRPSKTTLRWPWRKQNGWWVDYDVLTLFCLLSGDTFFQNNSILCAALL